MRMLTAIFLAATLSLPAAAAPTWTLVQTGGTVLRGVEHPVFSTGPDASQALEELDATSGAARVRLSLARVQSLEVLDGGRTFDVLFRDGVRVRLTPDLKVTSLCGQWEGSPMSISVAKVRRITAAPQPPAPPVKEKAPIRG